MDEQIKGWGHQGITSGPEKFEITLRHMRENFQEAGGIEYRVKETDVDKG